MSLSTSLNSAVSGLHVTARGIQVVADNIANVGTDGYGVRSLTQAARAIGGTGSGVIATGIQREGDTALLNATRLAQGATSGAALLTTFWTQIEQSLGDGSGPGSLVARISELDGALSSAIVMPETGASLARVAQAAIDLAHSFNSVHATIAQARDSADAEIARDIGALNSLLAQVAQINKDVQRQTVTGGSPFALIDQRQSLIDQIGSILPVTEILRDHGRVLLLAADATVLVDQQAAVFDFQRSPQPQPENTLHSGSLSSITLGNRVFGPDHSIFGQGRLSAAVSIRDNLAPLAQAALDGVAEDLVVRFSGNGIDPTLPAGAFGLFQDRDLPPSLNRLGLSGRLTVSAQINPDDPSSLFRLRDGLAATSSGPVGATGMLSNLRDSLRAVSSASGPNQPARDLHNHSVDLISFISGKRLQAEAREAYSANRATILKDQILIKGVDTDAQMQRLLVLEQNYAANARVITTIDAMMRTLLEI